MEECLATFIYKAFWWTWENTVVFQLGQKLTPRYMFTSFRASLKGSTKCIIHGVRHAHTFTMSSWHSSVLNFAGIPSWSECTFHCNVLYRILCFKVKRESNSRACVAVVSLIARIIVYWVFSMLDEVIIIMSPSSDSYGDLASCDTSLLPLSH